MFNVMKFSIGDKVLLKRTGEEGHVTSYIDKKMIEVEVSGTVFPVYIEDLDHPYLKWFTEKKPLKKSNTNAEPLPVERIIERKPKLARGIYLSFMPVFKTEFMEEVVDYIKVHLLNELPVEVKFSYELKTTQANGFSHDGLVHSFGNVYLHNITWSDMNDQPRFNWKLIDATHKNMLTAEGVLKIKPVKLFEHIKESLFNGAPSFSYLLIDDFVEQPQKEVPVKPDISVPQMPVPLVTRQTLEPFKFEVDLHADQLPPGWASLQPDAILKKQMDMLEHYVHLAIAHRQERMVVIHGLGKGKLKEAVHKYLKKVEAVSRFKNEWSGKYGFGATEIHFKY